VNNLTDRNRQRQADTYTSSGGLVRLVVREGVVTGAVVVDVPNPWVLRQPWLVPEDVD
jgi:hypothetical protein